MPPTPDDTPREDILVHTAGTEAQAVAEIAQAGAYPLPISPGALLHRLVPAGARGEIVDLERYLPGPHRARGTSHPATVDMFLAHVLRHQNPDRTTVWVHPSSGKIVAVFNDTTGGEDGEPGWRDHRSELMLTPPDEWGFWMATDRRMMTQVEFAEHIEQGMKEIVEPAAADMLELAQSFQAAQSASFRSARRLSDGTVQVQYDETIDATAGNSGQLQIPTEFKLAISPFLGEQPYAITARLRYRVSSGDLRLGYILDRPGDVVRDALQDIAGRLEDTLAAVFVGEPATAIA